MAIGADGTRSVPATLRTDRHGFRWSFRFGYVSFDDYSRSRTFHPADSIREIVRYRCVGLSEGFRKMTNHLSQLSKLPVRVIVRLAEKKVPVEYLVDLSPGVMLMFDKSCEDLLELYVNNQLLCRGEAVKIGEKFGLKINELNSSTAQQERVISG